MRSTEKGEKVNEVVETLKKAKILMQKGWTTGSMARGPDGNSAWSTSDEACCWCALGSLRAVCKYSADPEDFDVDAYEAARTSIETVLTSRGELDDVTVFNDAQKSVEPVLELFDEAIALAEAGQ